jgi:hypothetical protein
MDVFGSCVLKDCAHAFNDDLVKVSSIIFLSKLSKFTVSPDLARFTSLLIEAHFFFKDDFTSSGCLINQLFCISDLSLLNKADKKENSPKSIITSDDSVGALSDGLVDGLTGALVNINKPLLSAIY